MKRLSGIVSSSLALLLTIAFAIPIHAAKKKTVCSITINSDDEIRLMKAALSPNDFDFIELTTVGKEPAKSSSGEESDTSSSSSETEENSWLQKSCQAGVRCDMLVVSGHFGGVFFGSSGLSLPLETLEESACDPTCSGIFHNPKEVFLFGCNTLAGKDRDHRSPEEYLQVLLQDGFTRQQAEQVVAYRYSPIGNSFHDRMSRTFATVPRLYGFNSVGPSGKNSAPLLKQYLKTAAPRYSEYLSTLNDQTNTDLLSAFRQTSMVQTKGGQASRSPVCFIKDRHTTTLSKLQYIQQVLRGGQVLEMAPYLVNFFDSLKNEKLTDTEQQVLTAIRNEESAAKTLEPIVRTPWPGLLKPQIDILNLMLMVGWMAKPDYENATTNLVLGRVYAAEFLNYEVRDQICSLGIHLEFIDPKKITAKIWASDQLFSLISCLKPKNPEMALALFERYKSQPKRRSAILAAMETAGLIHPRVTQELAEIMKTTSDSGERREIANYFRSADLKQAEVLQALTSTLEMKNDPDTRKTLRKALLSLGREMPDIIRPALKKAIQAANPGEAKEIFDLLGPAASKKSEMIQADLKAAFLTPANSRELANVIHGMTLLELKFPELQKNLKDIAESKADIPLRAIAFTALTKFNSRDPSFDGWCEKMIASEEPAQVRAVVLNDYLNRHRSDKLDWFLSRILQEKDPYITEKLLQVAYGQITTGLLDDGYSPQDIARIKKQHENPLLQQVVTMAQASPSLNIRTYGGNMRKEMNKTKNFKPSSVPVVRP